MTLLQDGLSKTLRRRTQIPQCGPIQHPARPRRTSCMCIFPRCTRIKPKGEHDPTQIVLPSDTQDVLLSDTQNELPCDTQTVLPSDSHPCHNCRVRTHVQGHNKHVTNRADVSWEGKGFTLTRPCRGGADNPKCRTCRRQDLGMG